MKLPAFTGTTEKWKVRYYRFEAVAHIEHWTQEEKLSEILPRLQGVARVHIRTVTHISPKQQHVQTSVEGAAKKIWSSGDSQT